MADVSIEDQFQQRSCSLSFSPFALRNCVLLQQVRGVRRWNYNCDPRIYFVKKAAYREICLFDSNYPMIVSMEM